MSSLFVILQCMTLGTDGRIRKIDFRGFSLADLSILGPPYEAAQQAKNWVKNEMNGTVASEWDSNEIVLSHHEIAAEAGVAIVLVIAWRGSAPAPLTMQPKSPYFMFDASGRITTMFADIFKALGALRLAVRRRRTPQRKDEPVPLKSDLRPPRPRRG
jgi:hypothetical protein